MLQYTTEGRFHLLNARFDCEDEIICGDEGIRFMNEGKRELMIWLTKIVMQFPNKDIIVETKAHIGDNAANMEF